MRSLVWASVWKDRYPPIKGKFGWRQTSTEGWLREDLQGRESHWLQWGIYKPRSAKDCQETLEAEGCMERFFPRTVTESMVLLAPWLQTASPQTARQDVCVVWSHPVSGVCSRSPGNRYTVLAVFFVLLVTAVIITWFIIAYFQP